ncbi:lactate utilization protein [Desulfamplus magnetovallimortis]|nr:lactate utilization protein [Desulfamplus magnetovallimortis]
MDIVTEFKKKTSMVSSMVHEAQSIQDALEIAVSVCVKKSPAMMTNSSSETPHTGDSDSRISLMHGKTMAALDLDEDKLKILAKLCSDNNIDLITESLRNHGTGIDVGITTADYGIADTGTLVVSSDSEEKRLATMISEIHVALLLKSNIRPSALAMCEELELLTSKPSSYTAFITGPSRTADIERVLAIGVHGPLELHIILLDDIEK